MMGINSGSRRVDCEFRLTLGILVVSACHQVRGDTRMRNVSVAFGLAIAMTGATAGASQGPQLPPPCKASSVLASSIADKASAVPEEFQADLATGTVRLDVGAFLTGKPVPESKDLTVEWKATAGFWTATSASAVLNLLHKTNPNGILLWSSTTHATCHQDVVHPVSKRAK